MNTICLTSNEGKFCLSDLPQKRLPAAGRRASLCRLAGVWFLGCATPDSDLRRAGRRRARVHRREGPSSTCWVTTESAGEELIKTVDGAEQSRSECNVSHFLRASEGFSRVIIQDRRCHCFWRGRGKKAFPLLRSETFSSTRACFQTAIFNVKEREEMMCWTGGSVLLNHEQRPRGL